MIAKDASGFMYCVSSLGVTGVRQNITTNIGEMIDLVKSVKDIPCAVGFGISTPEQAKEMAKIAFEALEDKKGEDVCAIDISSVSVLADYFVIANGNSDSQVRALVENVEEKMHKAGYAAKETEGHRSGAWVLIDFGDVIVHIFDRENRQFYNLERIWNDGKRIDDVNEL